MVRQVSKKNKILLLLSTCFVSFSCFALSVVFKGFAASPKQTSSLFGTQSFEVAYGSENPLEERSGVLLTSQANGASVTFPEFSGEFALDLGIVGAEGARTFDTLTFEFTDQATDKKVGISFINDSWDGNVRISHQGANTYATAAGLSFTEGVSGIRFDGRTMQASVFAGGSEVTVFDFSSPSDMSRLGADYTLEGFDVYSVKMSAFSVHEGKSAQLYLYELSGESLKGETLENTAGAQIFGEPELYTGTVGKTYRVSAQGLRSYDVVDGFAEFDGEVKVFDKNGEEVALSADRSFVPAEAGVYTAQYRAKDSSGVFGESASFEFTVSTQASSVQWNLMFPVYTGNIPQGTSVILPAAEAVSSAATDVTSALEATLEIKAPDGTSVHQQSAEQGYSCIFDKTGTYQVVYSAADYDGTESRAEFSVTVVAGEAVSRELIAREYLVGEYLYLPEAVQGGKELDSEAVAPDGSRTDFPKILLDREGIWTIVYSDGGNAVFEEYVRVRNSVTGLWNTKNGVDVTAGVKTPDYYDFEAYGMEISGALTSGEAFYANPVNLSGKSKDEKIVEFLVTPAKQEQLELDRLELVIRDAYDPTNYITIGFEPNMWGYRQLTTVYLSLSTGQTYEQEFHMSTTLYGKFTGGKISTDPIVYDPTITKPFALYWDGETNSIYLSPGRTQLDKTLLADLDDPATFGVGNEWKGFTTGEAEIGFVFREINDTAHIIVTEFDGISFGKNYFTDTVAPTLMIGEEGRGAVGQVGMNYPCPEAYGVDSVDGRINDVFLKVYYVDGTRKVSVPTTGRFSFVPDRAGRYELVYSVTDRAGNTGMKTIYAEVAERLDPIALTESLDEVYGDTMRVGEVLRLKEIGAAGGGGKLTIRKYVLGSGFSEELESNSYLFTKEGSYVLRYSVTDYFGNTADFDFYFTVQSNDGPVFDNVMVPSYVLAGKPFTVPGITAKDYENGEVLDAAVEIYFDGEKVAAGANMVPEGDFTLRAVAKGADGRTTEQSFSVQVISPRSDENYIADHFIADENVTKTVANNGITFSAEGDGGFSFVNTVPMNQFTFSFSSDASSFGGVFAVKFTDSKNADVSVSVRFSQSGSKILYGINGGAMREMTGSVFATNGFSFGFVGNELRDADGKVIAVVTTTEGGDAFEKFSGDIAYVSFGFENVTGSMSVVAKSLCNQVLNSSMTDRIKPMIVFGGELVKSANVGDKITLPDALAADILDNLVTFEVLITAPDSSVVYEGAVAGFEGFTIDQFGKYYLTYTAKDSSGNTVYSYDFVQALNYEVPEITVNGKVPSSLKRGESFTVAAAEVEEGITLKIYLILPSGVRQLVSAGDKITAERTGTYRLMYYAYNSDYNSNLVIREITVS